MEERKEDRMVKVSEENEAEKESKTRTKLEFWGFFVKGEDLKSCGSLLWGDHLEKLEDLSDRESEVWVDVLVVFDVIDVLDSLSSVVIEFCDGSLLCLDWELVELQSFVSPTRVLFIVQCRQLDRRIRTHHLKRSKGTSRWKTRCGVRETERSLLKRNSTRKKVKVRKWKSESWNPCWVQMIRMWISDESWKKPRDEKGCEIFETFSSEGPSEFWVVSRLRWNEHQRRLNAQREELRSVQRTWQ